MPKAWPCDFGGNKLRDSGLYGFDGSGRVAGDYGARRDVFGDYGAGGYDGAIAYGNAGKYGGASAYPHIIAYGYRLSPLAAVAAFVGVKRMAGCVDAYAGADKHVVAYGDKSLVEHCEVEVDKHMVAEADVASVVDAQRLIDMQSGTRLAENLFQKGVERGGVVGVGVVKAVHQGAGVSENVAEPRMCGVIHLARKHLAPFVDESRVGVVRGGGKARRV